jgi:formylglycine-generating enzyme required for sulfatase activity
MSNKLIRVFDNIGFNFVIENDIIKPVSAIKTYNILNANHVGYLIPYIARNLNSRLFETGVGEIVFDNSGNIVVKRIETISSSNNNNTVDFPSSGNDFYVFANQSSFDKGLNNTIVIDKDSSLDAISALYLVDCSSKSISINLPSLDQSNNIIIELKLIESSNSLFVNDKNGSLVCTLDSFNNYARLASTGKDWVVLNNKPPERMGVQSLNNDSDTFSIMSGDINNAEMYWDSGSQRVFIGANSASSADTIIPTSGTYPFVVNNNTNGSDFIVYGSGSLNKNLFFSYDGRVGINIPSGSRPSTVFHIVNTVCQEGLRLENRTSCYPANITLYHKPSTDIASGSVVSQINLSAKNSTGNQTNYAQIESRAVNTTVYGEKGSLDITVVSGVTGIKTIQTTVDSTYVGYSGNRLQINNNGNLLLTNGSSQITVSPQSSITFSSSSLYATGTSYLTNISSQNVNAANITISNLASSGLLMMSGGKIVNSPLSVDSAGSLLIPVPANKLLSTTSTGAITGIYTLDDYFLTQQDITWNKYSARNATVCLRQITFSDSVPVEEFSVGDQVVIVSSGANFYRTITAIDLSNSNITGLLIDQSITQNSTTNITVSSITKGGYLTVNKHVDDGTISDASTNVLSIRPLIDTEFNTKQKDINFVVYGMDNSPALLVKANSGRSSISSGTYHPFASQRNDMFSIIVDSSGNGLSTQYSSANYNYDNTRNLFSGVVSNVGTNGSPSYYGTYDQNGNVAEWVEKVGVSESRDLTEATAGGSWSTLNDINIEASGLKGYEYLIRSSGYNYVGFRVASLAGLTDQTYISSLSGLNFGFTTVGNPKNVEDTSTTYLKNPTGSTTNYSPILINNLGVVNSLYRIGKYEVTNTQYAKFLNSVATTNDRGLYDIRMSSSSYGGITRSGLSPNFVYSVKTNMENKPVVFVNYLSAVRFINWMHNGAQISLSETNIDYNLDTGAYDIISVGSNSYSVVKGSYRKYWLPDMNEWHKAAYYEPTDSMVNSGVSTVNIKRNDPYVIASGIDNTTGEQTQLFANLSVSGWLYVDHLVVGDGTIRSSTGFTNITELETTNANANAVITAAPTNTLSSQWNSKYAIVTSSYVSCVAVSGCSFNAKPLRLDEDTISSCTNPTLLANNNTPWWCDNTNSGPGWFN